MKQGTRELVQFFILQNQEQVEKLTPLILHHKYSVVAHYLGMVDFSVNKVCICKIKSIVICCSCCSVIFIHFPHIKDTVLISLIQKRIA